MSKPAIAEQPPVRIGRARITTAAELGRIGLHMFIERGFDNVTVDDIAEAAGIGRRTFFRYFPSKNDLPWGDFDALLERMRQRLATIPPEVPLADALREATVAFNTYPDEELPLHRERMAVLLETPTLVAHSGLRYAAWRGVIADFAAERLGTTAKSLRANTIGRVCLAVTLASYEVWLADESASLIALIEEGFDDIRDVFGPEPT